MKRLLLAALLLFSFLASAQDAFVRRYTKMYSSNPEKTSTCNITVVYNSVETDADIVIYLSEGKIFKLYRTEKEVKIGYNQDGIKYQLVFCVDEDGNRMGMQIFDDDSTLRLLYPNNGYIEFYN